MKTVLAFVLIGLLIAMLAIGVVNTAPQSAVVRTEALSTVAISSPVTTGTPSTTSEATIDGVPVSQRVAELRSYIGDAELTAEEAQVCLKAAGFNVQVDGILGPETQSAFDAFVTSEKATGSKDMRMFDCLNAVFVHRIVNTPTSTVAAPVPASSIIVLSQEEAAGLRASPAVVDYSGRTEHVSGYTKKNGTYVQPYYRRPSH